MGLPRFQKRYLRRSLSSGCTSLPIMCAKYLDQGGHEKPEKITANVEAVRPKNVVLHDPTSSSKSHPKSPKWQEPGGNSKHPGARAR